MKSFMYISFSIQHKSVERFSVLGGDMTNIEGSNTEPRYVWSNHSLPVTDIHVGSGAVRSRVLTASMDQTCRVSIVFSQYYNCQEFSFCAWMAITLA